MSKTMEPYLMSVLSSRLYSIGLEMTNTLMRTARSQLMSVCHDLSTAICDRNGKVIALAESIPVHCANMGLTVSPCFSHPDGIQPGDLFLNNSPYHGNTHHADYTYIAPVFNEGELMFFAVTKGHQADIGNAIPSTYAPTARDMFEEGAIDWPCIKIQRDYKDVADIIKIAQMHNRVPEMWYGDYLACVGSSRVGEKRLAALCAEYGNEKIKEFCEAYQAYGAKRMREELKHGCEVGGWWEITQPHVEAAGLKWRGRFPWDWHADKGFSVGYTQEERRVLVDVLAQDQKLQAVLRHQAADIAVIGRQVFTFQADTDGDAVRVFCLQPLKRGHVFRQLVHVHLIVQDVPRDGHVLRKAQFLCPQGNRCLYIFFVLFLCGMAAAIGMHVIDPVL